MTRTTTHRLAREAGTPLTGIERASIIGAARGFWGAAPRPKARSTLFLPGVRLEDLQELPARLEREEAFAEATVRVEQVDGRPALIIYPRDSSGPAFDRARTPLAQRGR